MKYLYTIVIILVLHHIAFSQSIINNGVNIYVSDGSSLTMVSDYENLGDGQIQNDGDLYFISDFLNNGNQSALLPGGMGRTTFKGSSLQNIGGSTSTDFDHLNIESDVDLLVETYVWNELNLTGGKLNLHNNNLYYSGFSGINHTSDYYCIAVGSGALNMFVDMTMPSIFPVGTSGSFAPVTINTMAASDEFSVNIISDVLSDGISGTTIPEIEDCVNLSWNIQPGFPDYANYGLQLQWNESDEGSTFNRNQSAVGTYHNGSWIDNPASMAAGSNPFTQNINNLTFAGQFAVGDTESPMAMILDLMVDITALLEGPYNGSEMESLLNDDNLLPLAQPYNMDPWNYFGSESVTALPPEVVDWVLVETRDATDAASADESTILEQQAAFVLVNGSIVGMDGSSDLQFNIPTTQNLFVVVYHRNHLSVMSANPLTMSGGVYSYNFTAGENQAYSDTKPGQKEIATGIWGMFGGDGSGGGTISNYDHQNIWTPDAGESGYLEADYQLDGQVNNMDKNDIWFPNIGAQSQVPE